ncbi:hypothetical protein CHELA41_51459 [Hyphomicrobiales bacterium]|nr:hypothetical protein CHELA41_51459 [Hyphomicrobiales bacterium]
MTRILTLQSTTRFTGTWIFIELVAFDRITRLTSLKIKSRTSANMWKHQTISGKNINSLRGTKSVKVK